MVEETDKMLQQYDRGGLVSKNAMSDYFLASAGKMTEVEFVGKHKMSTLEFEKQFAEDNSVDISGTEKLSEVNTTPKGIKMDYSNKPKTMAMGGLVDKDPVSGNEIPPGSTAEEVRDDIPAMLSEGEYVIPADVLKYFGVNFFEKLRTKAKQGMLEMEGDGRTSDTAAPTPIPEENGTAPMAEGGLVDQPTFNSANFAVPGLSTIGASPNINQQLMGSSAYTYKEYFGPGGVSQMILFINGEPAQAIPAGYSETPVTAPTGRGTNSDNDRGGVNRAARGTTAGSTEGGGLGIFGNPLSNLDFSDTASVETWAEDKLQKTFVNRGMQVAGGLLGGAASAALEIRNIAEVSAAAQYYAEIGDQESSDRLMGMADSARENYGLMGRLSGNFSDGDRIFENYMESLNGGARQSSSRRSGTATQQVTEDVDRVFAEQAGRDSRSERAAKKRMMTRSGVEYETATSNDGRTTVNRATGSSAPTTSVRPQARPTRDSGGGGGFTSVRDMFDGGGPGRSRNTSRRPQARNKGGLVNKRTTKK